jgi:hypothetical protein
MKSRLPATRFDLSRERPPQLPKSWPLSSRPERAMAQAANGLILSVRDLRIYFERAGVIVRAVVGTRSALAVLMGRRDGQWTLLSVRDLKALWLASPTARCVRCATSPSAWR